jgi:thymidylate synthase (FAD)
VKLIKPSYKIIDNLDPIYILEKIEMCARTCYKSNLSNNFEQTKEFLRKIIHVRKHESVIEHFSFTVNFIIDRGVSHEIVRHRLASYSQESTRYVNYSKDKFGNQLTFIIPEWLPELEDGEYYYDIRNNVCYNNKNVEVDECTIKYLKELLNIEITYLDLIKGGWSAEKARDILPTATKTEIVVSANLREWRHILKLRTDFAAHPQMREIMRPFLDELKEKIPVIFEDIEY